MAQRPEEKLNRAIRQIISRAITPEGVIDLLSAVGLDKPGISFLSDELLVEVREMPKNVDLPSVQVVTECVFSFWP
jgi:type I restriction enzyme R subunit